MKKSLSVLIVLLLAIALVIAACGGNDAATGDDGDAATGAPVNLTMATGGTSGTYYAFGGAIATALNNAGIGVNINVNSTGASGENVNLIGSGETTLAIVQNDVLDYSYHGTNTWEGQPTVTNTAVLASLYPEVCQIIAVADSGIESVADLRGKSVSIGAIGSGVETNAKQILAAYGLSTDDIKVQNLDFAESAEAMKNRTLDACFITAGVPNTAVLDLATSRDVMVVPVDGAEAQSLLDQYPFYAVATITPGEYSFLSNDVSTIAVQATLICSTDLDEETAYNLVKTIFEKAEDIAASHEKGSYLSPDYAIQGVSVDFHPGAVRYYEEIGVL